MTAIDELCRMLAKMGVEYVLDEEYGKKYPPEQRVTWSCVIAGEDMTVTARDYCIGRDEGGEWEYCLDLEFHEVFTPEQAIAATLGRGTCKPTTYDNYLTKRLKPGEYYEFWEPACACSECGELIPMRRFCPNCGARIEVDG